MKSCGIVPPGWKFLKCIFKSRIASCGMYLPSQQKLTSSVTLQCILGMTTVTCHFCFQLWWVCTDINFGVFQHISWQKNWYKKIIFMHAMSVKPPTCQMILYVLSNDDCKFAINLFPISWGPLENINLLYLLLKMQIWNGFNVFNIPGNLIKDINVNPSVLIVGWKVVEWTPQDWQNFFKCIFKWRIGSCGMSPPLRKFSKIYCCMAYPMVPENLP